MQSAELPVSARMVIIALSIPEIHVSDYRLCLIFDCLLYFNELELYKNNKIAVNSSCRTKNYNKMSDLCQFGVLLCC